MLLLIMYLADAFSPLAETLHVSPTGDDHNDGSARAPLRTFGGAQYRPRLYPASVSVTILFQEGLYALNGTQVLTEKDSGAARLALLVFTQLYALHASNPRFPDRAYT